MNSWKRKEVIGGATLYLGDARELLREFSGAIIHMIFTDPPYGHNTNNGDLIHHRGAALGHLPRGSERPIANDGAEANELFRSVLPELNRVLAHKGMFA